MFYVESYAVRRRLSKIEAICNKLKQLKSKIEATVPQTICNKTEKLAPLIFKIFHRNPSAPYVLVFIGVAESSNPASLHLQHIFGLFTLSLCNFCQSLRPRKDAGKLSRHCKRRKSLFINYTSALGFLIITSLVT